jgi:potassium/hydrogen antiporter
VTPAALAALRPVARLPLSEDARILMAIRDGRALHPPELERLEPADTVLVLSPAAGQEALDRIFGARERPAEEAGTVFGEFTLEASAPVRALASLYGLPIPEGAAQSTLADFIAERLGKEPTAGDRLPLGEIELVVQEVEDGTIRTVGIELEPEERRAHQIDPRRIRERLAGMTSRLRALLPRRWRRA